MKLIIALIVLAGLAGMGCAAYWNNPPEQPPTITPTTWKVIGGASVPKRLTPTPAPINLLTTRTAPLWVHLSDGEFFLTVQAEPAFAIDQFGLNVLVDGRAYCNTARIYEDDGPVELSCDADERAHRSVKRVSAQTYLGDLRCERNIKSDGRKTLFACDWR